MKLITRDDLKKKFDNKDPFKLVFVLGDWHFKAKHIPGSVNLANAENAETILNKDDEIVVYCANVTCPASIYAYNTLSQMGYTNVYRYAEGIQDWETAGYPLEGESVS